ncbi:hypothetical protein VNO78_06532 [Psophocarpus tetragonolobus]|uniref:Uncharacterized protein n=1 Tax=Psophocarpus tetragonolobus TaxID=3891 RepID=A0AAN9SVA7_PSOTE
MDLTIKRINWVGNIYQKFEAVCQEVDDIVGQDAVKYLENQVQNVGDSVKKLYSGVVHELLPFHTLPSSKCEDHSVVDLTNNIGHSVESVAGCEDNSNKRDEENPINNFIKSLQDSNATDIANNQQDGAPIEHNLTNQVGDETCSDSLEVEDSCIKQEEVGVDSRETSGSKQEYLHTSLERVSVEPVPKPMNLMSVREKESPEFSLHSESYSDSSDSESEVSIKTKDSIDVNAEQNSSLVVEENTMNSSISQVLSSQTLDEEEESIKASLFSESSDVHEVTHGIIADVSPDASLSSERSITKTEPSCFRSSLTLNTLSSKSLGSYYFEIESCKNNSGDATQCICDRSMACFCCESLPHVAGQVMDCQGGLVFSGYSQSMDSNDNSLVSSIESSMEDIELNDNPKLEDCVFVDDSELYAASSRIRKLRSYKKRIRDAFASKKRLSKEYEQLAIWYGDTDIELRQGFSQTFLPFNSRTNTDPKNAQVLHASETEWELL